MTSGEGSDLDVALDFLSQPLTGGPGVSIARFLDEDTVMRLSTGHVYLGIEGLIRFYQERTHEWQEARLEASGAEELEAGWVLVEGSLRLQPRSGSEQIQPGAWLLRLRDGRVSDWLFFRTGAEARTAAAGPGDPRDFGRDGLPADLERGIVQDLGHGYELVCNHPEASADQAFLLLRRDDAPARRLRVPDPGRGARRRASLALHARPGSRRRSGRGGVHQPRRLGADRPARRGLRLHRRGAWDGRRGQGEPPSIGCC